LQNYPRISDEDSPLHGYVDESKLQPHVHKIPIPELESIVVDSLEYANKKSSRTIFKIIGDTTEDFYKKTGKDLFKYFLQYCGDPASTAHACLNRQYSDIGREQFRNRLLQKQRMNSGWRYQYIAKTTALSSKRFLSVSDLGAEEADFNATIKILNSKEVLNIYTSVKNRSNTVGGQDMPKAIRALENVASNDKNRTGPFICVFGIVMERGFRNIRTEKKSKNPYSYNTEIWMSDFFWPFFSNYSYEEIIKAVLSVLIDKAEKDEFEIEIPPEILDSFGECCRRYGLLDDKGVFNDAYKLVDLFCGITQKPSPKEEKALLAAVKKLPKEAQAELVAIVKARQKKDG
jgi:hypothetical protein